MRDTRIVIELNEDAATELIIHCLNLQLNQACRELDCEVVHKNEDDVEPELQMTIERIITETLEDTGTSARIRVHATLRVLHFPVTDEEDFTMVAMILAIAEGDHLISSPILTSSRPMPSEVSRAWEKMMKDLGASVQGRASAEGDLNLASRLSTALYEGFALAEELQARRVIN